MAIRITLVLTTLLAVAPGAPGQILPGGDMASAARVRAEFMRTVLGAVEESRDRWLAAWAAGDAEGLADVYTDEARLVTPAGDELVGREAIRRHFAGHGDGVGPIQLFPQDADASHRMVMTVSRYLLKRPDGGGLPGEGSVLTVWIGDGHGWRIRAQVFTPGP